MKNRDKSFVPFNTAGKTAVNKSRRIFLKQSSIAAATTSLASLGIATSRPARATEQSGFNRLSTNSMGFNGHRQDPVSGFYHLGNGYRVYNPGLMRFHAADSMSPFGRGSVNSYAYTLGDPINLRDPSGHFALFSLLIGAIIGAVIGAVVSAAVEGIRAAATGDEFDFKQVFIGAALGFISGGFGAAAIGAKTGVQVGIAVADAVVSGAADFGLNVAAGSNLRDAGVGAGVGAAIGLVTFGLGKGIGTVVSKVSRKLVRQNNQIGFLLSPKKRPKLTLSIDKSHEILRSQGVEYVHGSNSASLDGLTKFRAILTAEQIDGTPYFHRNGGLNSGERGYTFSNLYKNQPISQGVSLNTVNNYRGSLQYAGYGTSSSDRFPILYGLDGSTPVTRHLGIDHPISPGGINIDRIAGIYTDAGNISTTKDFLLSRGFDRLANVVRPLP
ncbi:RHS repeat-associated core domain-containing protein [Microbulbifer sp. TYP-18]|uniref:RHS repeat-associated core domain-containing protein n=1 Tax=Microbulbifer sp. TYP-18 TaxID=3230024 RepID=UPI0034C61768